MMQKLITDHSDSQRKIAEIIENMRKVAEEREATAVYQFPLWHEGKSGSPNSFLRSALFAAIQGKDRVYLEDVTLFSQHGITVKFTGKQLNQEDMTVWLTLVDLARQHPLGTECSFTAYGILKHMGLAIGGDQRKRLLENTKRLAACLIEIKSSNSGSYYGHLIDEFVVDENTKHYKLTLNKKLINLFGEKDWTALNWEQRKQLRSKPLAQKLHEYYSSHERPLPVTIQFLHDITGSNNSQLRDFKRSIKAALEGLVKIGFLANYKVEGDKVTVERKNPRALPQIKAKD
jgi:hypothetical protein